MIVVKLEMWPKGDEKGAVEFGRMYIANQKTLSEDTSGKLGDYQVSLLGGVWGRKDLYKKPWKSGTVRGFERLKRGAWDLLYESLKNIVGRRNT